MAHDVLIKNGTVVDGTGASAFAADVAIDGDKITAFRTYFDTRKLPSSQAQAGRGQGSGDGRVQISGQGNGTNASAGDQENGRLAPADSNSDLDRAQREAAEQRASGGYN